MNFKIAALTFIFLSALIILFPPFNWGEERLQTENERAKTVKWGLEYKPAKEVLPLKQRAFLFGETKYQFKIKDPSPNVDYESEITLDRKLITADFVLEQLLASVFSVLFGWLYPKLSAN